MAQLEGSGRGGLGSYNTEAFQDLTLFLQEHPMRDGDAWLELLLKKNEMLGVQDLHTAQTFCCCATNLPFSIKYTPAPLRGQRPLERLGLLRNNLHLQLQDCKRCTAQPKLGFGRILVVPISCHSLSVLQRQMKCRPDIDLSIT